jgi:hypothetical protein
LIGDEVAAASEEELQFEFGDLLLTCLELCEIRSHPSLR